MSENKAFAADEAAFNGVVQSHYDTLMRTALQITRHQQSAEDIVQEAFLRLWQHRHKIIAYNTGGWLYTVTTHLAYKHLKKAKRNITYARLDETVKSWHTDVEDQLLQKENQQTYDSGYMRLPEKQQAVYRLSREQGLSRDEIACQLRISPNTVKNHLVKAVQFMKDHVRTCGLLAALVVVNNLFFNLPSTKPTLRDLYNREMKVNKKTKSLLQHASYFKNNESLTPVQQRVGYTGHQHRDRGDRHHWFAGL